MNPKLFIGSSSEALEVANAIQQNLTHDAETTVWNQGIFRLSSTVLNDLISAVGQSDYAIFVFNPDDIAIIRDQKHSTVRDNVIFELGLFIGKLGLERVFYVMPQNENMHLPTDLLGLNSGSYNSKRADGNLIAALGPFCTQIRAELKKFRYVNLEELHDESETAKKIALDKPFSFEYLLLAELIETRLVKTASMHKNLQNGVYFVRSRHISDEEYRNFFRETLQDFRRFITIFSTLINEGISTAMGPLGVPSKFADLLSISNDFLNLSVELFNWEARNEQFIPPEELSEVKDLLRGTSSVIASQINKLPSEIRRVVKANQEPIKVPEDCIINIKIDMPPQVEQALQVFQRYYANR